MGLTVREALRLPALSEAVLLAGEAGLDRVITSVNIMEVPNIARFVKKDELLLTTVYPIKDDPEAQANLISTLVNKGLAALAIKPVADWLGEVPPQMVRQAKEAGFPLIRLPQDTSFNEILNPILAEILNRQAAMLVRNEAVHQTLTNIVLDGGSLGEIAAMLATMLGAPVSIHNVRLRLMAFCAPPEKTMRALEPPKLDLIRELAQQTEKLAHLVGGRQGQVGVEVDGQRLALVVHPVMVARENYAHLIVWHGHKSQEAGDGNIIQQAATVVALEIAKLRAVAEVEKRFRSSFVEDLLQGRVSSRGAALSRGEAYGWDLSGAFVPLLVEIDDFQRLSRECRGQRQLALMLRQAWDAVTLVVAGVAPGAVCVDLGGRILVLAKGQDARLLAHRIQREAGAGHSFTVSVGLGRSLDDIMALKDGFRQASQALEMGRAINGPESVTSFDDLGIYRILTERTEWSELDRFADELLGGLVESDRRGGSDLVQTLGVFLECNGNLRETARKLCIHYNTLRYRLGRIEEITRTDLGSAEGRLNLQVALKIYRMRAGAEG